MKWAAALRVVGYKEAALFAAQGGHVALAKAFYNQGPFLVASWNLS